MTAHTHVISTHNWRRTARRALAHYERLMGIANGDLPPRYGQEKAQRELASLGLTVESPLRVKRATSARRGRWEVVAGMPL
jgi:hypothetical protein